MKKIVLASGSPRRKMLLEWAEIPFEVIVSDVDESFPIGTHPADAALLIAKNKNSAVYNQLNTSSPDSERVIISADTIVVLGDEIIGKPNDHDHAIETLRKLSGQKHAVMTAVVMKCSSKEISFVDTTYVTFNDLTEDQITHYVTTYKPFDKAGSYAIQEWIGVVGIKSIDGDFYNVMGLPISRVIRLLHTAFD